ncbi:hypothetical protein BASA61_002476 [Batrachochytrium salamandrivorans]|nr:hypothetical protein BASA61_002476 [Batrachochytrium salamandrivorans]KAH9271522.1 hypothetical protein BASA83_006377 [Batrachochytrium salamandrivorans]
MEDFVSSPNNHIPIMSPSNNSRNHQQGTTSVPDTESSNGSVIRASPSTHATGSSKQRTCQSTSFPASASLPPPPAPPNCLVSMSANPSSGSTSKSKHPRSLRKPLQHRNDQKQSSAYHQLSVHSQKRYSYTQLDVVPPPTLLPLASEAFPIVSNIVIDGEAMELAGNRQIAGYIDWISSCLVLLDRVQILGIDPALPVVSSISLLLLGENQAYEQTIETLTLNAKDGTPKSALKIVLTRKPTQPGAPA